MNLPNTHSQTMKTNGLMMAVLTNLQDFHKKLFKNIRIRQLIHLKLLNKRAYPIVIVDQPKKKH